MSENADAHWHVLGAGAIGCLFAASLHDAGCAVTLLQRSDTPSRELAIERNGVARRLSLPRATADSCGAVSHLLVTTKAYDVRAAVSGIAHKLGLDAPVVLLANGMGLREEVLGEHPGLAVFCATTTRGAHRVEPDLIREAGGGMTRVGGTAASRTPHWFQHWQKGIADCHWDADIDAALWHKLAINCAINPLTALHRCRNGELANDATLTREVQALCAEISQISYAAGYTVTANTLLADTTSVINATANNRSSMLQDVEAGRRTEIDYITGHLLKVAGDYHIPAPNNHSLYDKVTAIGT